MQWSKKSTLEMSESTDGLESRLIQNSAKQMNEAINDAFAEIGVLSQLISTMKKQARKLKNNSQSLQDKEIRTEELIDLVTCAENIIELAIQSQARMQFADRMHHRLYDVQDNLKKVAKSVSEQEQTNANKGNFLGIFSHKSDTQKDGRSSVAD